MLLSAVTGQRETANTRPGSQQMTGERLGLPLLAGHALPGRRQVQLVESVAAETGARGPAHRYPVQGEKLARRWCAACHVVANDQTHGTDNVPTFAAIAKIPGFDANKVAMFLRDPHPKMPDMRLSNTEAADLAAYIVGLGK